MRSLRAQLYIAIAIAVMVSVALSLLAGAWLVHRSVKRQDLKALARQAEVIATREGSSPLPVQRVARGVFLGGSGHERLWFVDPATLPALLPDAAVAELQAGRAAQGTLVTGHARFLFAARGVSRRETVILLRSAKDEAGDWTPYGI